MYIDAYFYINPLLYLLYNIIDIMIYQRAGCIFCVWDSGCLMFRGEIVYLAYENENPL